MGGADLQTIRRDRPLAAMPAEDADALAPHLEGVPLGPRLDLERSDEPIAPIHFPVSGMASVVAVGDRHRDRRTETGIFGGGGMSGLPVVLGNDRSSRGRFVQIPGEALPLPADALRQAMDARARLPRVLPLHVLVWTVQLAHTAPAQGRARLEERLARWLVTSHDRTGGGESPLTREVLSPMLGVRRAGITMVTHLLKGRGLIRTRRGAITVLDREGFAAVAYGVDGMPGAGSERLLGPSSPAKPAGGLRGPSSGIFRVNTAPPSVCALGRPPICCAAAPTTDMPSPSDPRGSNPSGSLSPRSDTVSLSHPRSLRPSIATGRRPGRRKRARALSARARPRPGRSGSRRAPARRPARTPRRSGARARRAARRTARPGTRPAGRRGLVVDAEPAMELADPLRTQPGGQRGVAPGPAGDPVARLVARRSRARAASSSAMRAACPRGGGGGGKRASLRARPRVKARPACSVARQPVPEGCGRRPRGGTTSVQDRTMALRADPPSGTQPYRAASRRGSNRM